jgi:hypothetical protein
VTYFRSIGGSFGTAVFGSICSNRLTANIARGGAAGWHDQRRPEPRGPEPARSPRPPGLRADASADALQTVSLAAAAVAAFAFALSWLLPEVKLRRTVDTTDRSESRSLSTRSR